MYSRGRSRSEYVQVPSGSNPILTCYPWYSGTSIIQTPWDKKIDRVVRISSSPASQPFFIKCGGVIWRNVWLLWAYVCVNVEFN